MSKTKRYCSFVVGVFCLLAANCVYSSSTIMSEGVGVNRKIGCQLTNIGDDYMVQCILSKKDSEKFPFADLLVLKPSGEKKLLNAEGSLECSENFCNRGFRGIKTKDIPDGFESYLVEFSSDGENTDKEYGGSLPVFGFALEGSVKSGTLVVKITNVISERLVIKKLNDPYGVLGLQKLVEDQEVIPGKSHVFKLNPTFLQGKETIEDAVIYFEYQKGSGEVGAFTINIPSISKDGSGFSTVATWGSVAAGAAALVGGAFWWKGCCGKDDHGKKDDDVGIDCDDFQPPSDPGTGDGPDDDDDDGGNGGGNPLIPDKSDTLRHRTPEGGEGLTGDGIEQPQEEGDDGVVLEEDQRSDNEDPGCCPWLRNLFGRGGRTEVTTEVTIDGTPDDGPVEIPLTPEVHGILQTGDWSEAEVEEGPQLGGGNVIGVDLPQTGATEAGVLGQLGVGMHTPTDPVWIVPGGTMLNQLGLGEGDGREAEVNPGTNEQPGLFARAWNWLTGGGSNEPESSVQPSIAQGGEQADQDYNEVLLSTAVDHPPMPTPVVTAVTLPADDLNVLEEGTQPQQNVFASDEDVVFDAGTPNQDLLRKAREDLGLKVFAPEAFTPFTKNDREQFSNEDEEDDDSSKTAASSTHSDGPVVEVHTVPSNDVFVPKTPVMTTDTQPESSDVLTIGIQGEEISVVQDPEITAEEVDQVPGVGNLTVPVVLNEPQSDDPWFEDDSENVLVVVDVGDQHPLPTVDPTQPQNGTEGVVFEDNDAILADIFDLQPQPNATAPHTQEEINAATRIQRAFRAFLGISQASSL